MILVAEDEEIVRDFVISNLRACGYVVLAADNGASALAVAMKHDGPISLLLSDLQMPHVSGVQLAKQVTRDRPDTKVLITSGCDPDIIPLDPAWNFIGKPFKAHELAELVSGILTPEAFDGGPAR